MVMVRFHVDNMNNLEYKKFAAVMKSLLMRSFVSKRDASL